MHNICKMHNQNGLDSNDDISLALLKKRSTPTNARPPSPATQLFKRLMRAYYPKRYRESIIINNNDAILKPS